MCSSWLLDQRKLPGIVDNPLKRIDRIRRKEQKGNLAVDGTESWFDLFFFHIVRERLFSSCSPPCFWNCQAVSSCTLTDHVCVNKALCSYRLGIKPAVGPWRCSTFRSTAWLDQQVWHEAAHLKGIPHKKLQNSGVCAGDIWNECGTETDETAWRTRRQESMCGCMYCVRIVFTRLCLQLRPRFESRTCT